MALKAVSKRKVASREPVEQVIDPGDIPEVPPEIPDDDGLVMVVFPKETWNKVEEIARRSGVAPAAVLSEAIKEFDEKLNKLSG
jgi:hypothetical protein